MRVLVVWLSFAACASDRAADKDVLGAAWTPILVRPKGHPCTISITRRAIASFRLALCRIRSISVAGRHLGVRRAFGGFSGQVALGREARLDLLYIVGDDALGRSEWRQAYTYASAMDVRCCWCRAASLRLRLQSAGAVLGQGTRRLHPEPVGMERRSGRSRMHQISAADSAI